MNKGRFQILSVVLVTSLGVATNGCGGGDDDSSGSSATGGSAGKKGAGGKAGGSAGGLSGKGGSSGSGGTGGASSGGVGGTGAAGQTGGSAGLSAGTGGSAGMAGTGTGGAGAQGGMGGMAMGGMGGMPSYCYESLYVPLAMENDQADFEIDYGDATPINLSATTLSVRLRAETAGNAGGAQVYVKNGTAQNYAVAYLGWNNLTDLSSFTTLTYDISQATGTTGFDPTAIRYVGVNINAGSTFDGADFKPATVYVNSITFSDGASSNLDFNDGVPLLAVNQFNSPVAGATASAAICQDETGTGGMGGMSGTAGSTSSGGIGGQTGGTAGSGGTEAGAAGLGGEGGLAGADQGTGGSSGTGGSAGTSNGGMSGTGSGGKAGAAGTSGAGGSGGASANLIINGDFESGLTTDWASWGTGTFQTSTTAHSGTYSLLVTNRTGSNINIVQNITSVVSTGHTYAVSGWVRTSVASNGHFTAQIDCATTADSYPWIPSTAVDFSNAGWTQVAGTLDLTTACTGDTINAVNLYLEGMAAGVDVYLDDVTMTLN